MSNKDQKSEQTWEYVDKLTRKEYKSTTLDMVKGAKPLEGLELIADKVRKDKLSLVTRFKAGAIERKAALEKMQVIYDAQLEATKHALRRAVDVEKERVDLIANKYIFEITEEYLRDMRDLGILNEEIIKQGYGFAYTRFPFRYMERFRDRERRAREAGRGLWGSH